MAGIFSLALVTLAAAPQFVTLGWDYDTTDADCFKVYMSADVTNPLANWKLVATVPGSNLVADVPVLGQHGFYFVTASNFLGESVPSNILRLPGWTNVANLKVKGVK